MTKQTVEVPIEGKKYDAIVVGAGPSGCSCALYLANAGREVLLLDRAQFPREKVCGDAFSGKSIGIARELGILPKIQKLPYGTVHSLTMISPSGKKVNVPFPNAAGMEFAGYTVERKEIDNLFFTAAKEHKRITAVENFIVDGLEKTFTGAVCGVRGYALEREERREAKYFAKVVVGADGAASAVSRMVGQPNQPVEHVFSAIRGYYTGITGMTDGIELYFIDEVLPGYLWIFPMANGRANVGLGILSSDLVKRKMHPNKILEQAIAKNQSLAPRFANAKLEGRVGGWSIPNGSYKKKNTGNGWVLVGDAASLVDPFSGEGVGNALTSGKYAAQAIDGALSRLGEGEAIPAFAMEEYEGNVAKYLRPEMDNSYRLQKLCRIRFLLNLFLGKAADKPEVRQMLVDMLGSQEEKKKVVSPLFYLKLLLP